ncbi:MAG: hypothetical protein HQL69_04045 [Magnetococcales bacterium]|nr:hypothetical protein [Magnetococcales bacterium]
MYVKWTRQAQGFNQATYPNKNYNLSADLVTENVVDGFSQQQHVSKLGSVTVEENPHGELTFLFGSQLAFWKDVRQKLEEVELSAENIESITAELSSKIPMTN